MSAVREVQHPDVSVSIDEVERHDGKYLRGLVFRRIGKSDEWFHDGLEGVSVPLSRGETIARVVLAGELDKRFGVSLLPEGGVLS